MILGSNPSRTSLVVGLTVRCCSKIYLQSFKDLAVLSSPLIKRESWSKFISDCYTEALSATVPSSLTTSIIDVIAGEPLIAIKSS